jgi:catechol 2,3-dioxygenase-like lactoylglutathione lyase family enzyme
MQIEKANTILYCTHWEETVHFYRAVLALDILFSNDWFVEFKLNNEARLSIADERRASIKSNKGKGITISLRIDSLQKLFQYMKECNYKPSSIKKIWGKDQFFVFDPEGNRIEFWSDD